MGVGGIRDTEVHAKRNWHWHFLNEVMPPRVSACDVDGLYEINGHFLFLEGKSPGAKPKPGQAEALIKLSMQPRTHVLAIYGEAPHPNTGRSPAVVAWRMYRGGMLVAREDRSSIASVQAMVVWWLRRSKADEKRRIKDPLSIWNAADPRVRSQTC